MRAKRNLTAKYGGKNVVVGAVVGATENYGSAWNWPLADGRDLTREDVDRASKVCLLGDTVARELFGNQPPQGHTIFIQNIPFQVVGRLAYRGMSGGGGDIDDRVVIPLTTSDAGVSTWTGTIFVRCESNTAPPTTWKRRWKTCVPCSGPNTA